MALRNIGVEHEITATSEVDEYAILSYHAIHTTEVKVPEATEEEMQKYMEEKNIPLDNKGKRKKLTGKRLKDLYVASVANNNLGDISKIKSEEIPIVNLFTYSFPCFTGETLVQTNKGYKRIDEIEVGDLVLTHKNRYQKVIKVVNQGKKPILKVEGMAIDEIKTTQNHPFLVRKRIRKYDSKNKTNFRVFEEPHWLKAEELTRDYYLGIPINNENKIPEWKGYTKTWYTGFCDRIYKSNLIKPLLTSNDFWWLMGRYVADGWCRQQGGIVIAINEEKLPYFESKIKGMFNYNLVKETTCYKAHIPLKELSLFVERFGYYAHNKKISQDVLDLPKNLLKAFLDGYISGDGSFDEMHKYYQATTTSKLLAYGLGQCILKVYNRPYSIYKSNRPKETFIEGRKVSQKDTYLIVFKTQDGIQDKAFCEDGYCWFPFNRSSNGKEEVVYDIEVEGDHSFTANNVIVHNCTDISGAGLQKGLTKGSGTKSSLLWECERVIETVKPKYLLMENVKNLVSKKFKADFENWLKLLENLGYTNYWKILNSKDYGVPQNRERVFVVSILDCKTEYKFPEKIPLTKCLRDLLEEKVDEKYYITQEQMNRITFDEEYIERKKQEAKTENSTCVVFGGVGTKNFGKQYRQGNRIYDSNAIATCLQASPLGNTGGNSHLYKIDQIGRYDTPTRKNSNRFRVYNEDGLAPTISTMEGGGRNPYISEHETEFRVRKLTPKECWRLMGITDEDYEKASKVVSNSQLYKQAGNAIVVNVLEGIFKNLNLK